VKSLTGTVFHVYDTTDSRTGKKCQETVYTVTMTLNSLFFCDQKKKNYNPISHKCKINVSGHFIFVVQIIFHNGNSRFVTVIKLCT